MKKILPNLISLVATLCIFSFFSCTEVNRDNPYDSGGTNYKGEGEDEFSSSSVFSGISSLRASSSSSSRAISSSSNVSVPIIIPSSSSVAPVAKPSSSSVAAITTLYCDYGYPTTAGGGCFQIDDASECNTADGGKVANSCGRTDLIYCDWGPRYLAPSLSWCGTEYCGGCYIVQSRDNCKIEDEGYIVDRCPESSF